MNFDMLKQAQQMKSKLEKVQKELAKTVLEAEAGKGAVKVTINGQQKILSVKIAPEAMNPQKPQELEKLIMKAIGDATDKSLKLAEKEMKTVTGGIKIPGLM